MNELEQLKKEIENWKALNTTLVQELYNCLSENERLKKEGVWKPVTHYQYSESIRVKDNTVHQIISVVGRIVSITQEKTFSTLLPPTHAICKKEENHDV